MFFLSAALSLVIIGVTLRACLHMIYPARASADDSLHLLLTIAERTLVIVGILGMLFAMMSVLAWTIIIAGLVIWAAAVNRRRKAQQYGLLSLVGLAASHQIPLVPCVQAFASEEPGKVSRRARSLAENLELGMPLAAAAHEAPGALPRWAEVTAHVGQQLGALGPALREAAESQALGESFRQMVVSRLLYASSILAFVPLVISFLMIKIIPSIQKIFEDFDTELPAITQLLILLASQPLLQLIWPLLSVVTTILLVYSTLAYIGWAPSWGPMAREVERSRVLRALALAAERDVPLAKVMEAVMERHPSGTIRERLFAAEDRMLGGEPWCDALLAERLLRPAEAAVLRAAERAGNLAWALREMADRGERRLLYRLEVLLQIVSPLVILALGMLMAFLATAFFLPLVKLIHSLT